MTRAVALGKMRYDANTDKWLVRTRASRWPFVLDTREDAEKVLASVTRFPRGVELPTIRYGGWTAHPEPDVSTRHLWAVYDDDGVRTPLRIELAWYSKWGLAGAPFGVLLKRGSRRLGHVVGLVEDKKFDGEWVRVGVVSKSHLNAAQRNKRLGGLLYRAYAALLEAQNPSRRTAIAPSIWYLGTGTSTDAQRLWRSLQGAGLLLLPGKFGFYAIEGVGRGA